MRVLLAGSEAVPFAKTGGLADVLGALPKALAAKGHDAVLVMPLYGSIDRAKLGLEKAKVRFEVAVEGPGGWREEANLWIARLATGAHAWFLENESLYGRYEPYGDQSGDFADNAKRFAFLSHVACQILRAPPDGKRFDVLHAHDWQAALSTVFHKTIHRDDPVMRRIGSLFTIHNLAYQGLFPAEQFPVTGLPQEHFNWQELEFWKQVSFLKGGLVHADLLSTVSRKYAEEILTEEFGCGMEGILSARKADLHGIVNGIDYDEWSPDRDRFLPARFSASNPSPKDLCRNVLLREVGLPRGDDVPLIGCVSRLVEQKGFDLVSAALDRILDRARFVLLGSGDAKLEERFRAAAMKRPDRMAVRVGYDEALAHRISAGCDMYLMPSAFEPCGLTQMYGLRYGAVPIVRAVGGLDDTVIDADIDPGRGNGFKFGALDPERLVATVERAVAARRDKQRWTAIRLRGMEGDYSWERAADQYGALYTKTARIAAKRS